MLGSPDKQIIESAKRTAELRILLAVSRPFHGLRFMFTFDPTDESVGYFHVVRCEDENRSCFLGEARQ